MRRRTTLLLALLGALLLLPAVVAAQPTSDQIRAELERTDRILERAHDLIGLSLTARAGEFLREADKLHKEAWDAYAKGRLYFRLCVELTRKARDLARRAVETAEIEIKAHESIQDLVESTQLLVDEAGPEVREAGDAQAERLLSSGVAQLQRAEDAYRDREYRMAIRLAAIARDLVQRALLRARGSTGSETTQIATAIDRTDALLEEVRVGLSVSPDPKATALFEEASGLQARAREFERSGRGPLALRFTTQARQIGLDALLLLSRNPDREDVERAVDVVGQILADLGPEILASGSEKGRVFYDSARDRHREAADLLARGELARALDAARTAEGLLHRASEAAGLR
jgi:hypothetical protein